jgi:hypothetical protein
MALYFFIAGIAEETDEISDMLYYARPFKITEGK